MTRKIRRAGNENSLVDRPGIAAALSRDELMKKIETAIASLERGEGVPHEEVKARVASWSARKARRRS